MPNIRITSPEQIHDYIRVTSPGVWIVLSAILAFFAGLFIWIFAGSLEISFTAPVYTDGQISRAFLTSEQFSRLKTDMHARIHNTNITGEIINLSSNVLNHNEIINITGLKNFALMGLDENDNDKYFQAQIKFSRPPLNEINTAVFIIDSVKPLNFLLK